MSTATADNSTPLRPLTPSVERPSESGWLLSVLAVAAAACCFLLADDARGRQLWHWFVIPVAACGVLVCEDVVRWLRGELDVFDPIGVVGLFGVHFFFLAPLLHVRWDYWMQVVPPPPDWRPWLGGMAVLNLLGLLVYRGVRSQFSPDRQAAPDGRRDPAAAARVPAGLAAQPRQWRLRPHRFRWSLLAGLALAAALQSVVYLGYGGVWGYIQAVEVGRHTFLGVSRIAVISDAFPVLLLIGYVVVGQWQRRRPSWIELGSVMFGFFVLKLLFGGLHGSRGSVAFAVFWAVGMVHVAVRPLPRRLLLSGAACLVAFAYFYGFYKSAGAEGLRESLRSSGSRSTLAEEIRRPLAGTLLGDFGRSDVQAYVLYRLMGRDSDFRYGLGRTYYGAAITMVPGPLWRNRPPTKVKEGTEALYGRDTYRDRPLTATQQEDRYSGMTSKVFGLAGETMLNFGPLLVPLAFAGLGVVVGWTHRRTLLWNRRDPRRLFLPILANLCLVVIMTDSDNILTFLEKVVLFPFLVVAWSSCRAGRHADAAETTAPGRHEPLPPADRRGATP